MKSIREKYRKKRIRRNIIITASAVTVVLLFVMYISGVIYFKNHFFFHTQLNGIDVGRMTAEDAQDKITQETQDYLLTIYDRDGAKYHIKGYDIDYEYEPAGEEAKLVAAQQRFAWPMNIFSLKENDMQLKITFDEDLLQKAIDALACFDEDNIIEPENAEITLTDDGFEVTKEVSGNKLITDNVKADILKAIMAENTELTFSDADYENPEVTSEDAAITECMATLDNYMKSSITYEIADNNEVVDKSMIMKWLDIDDNYAVTLDEDEVARYVQLLASEYNTYADKREFKTTAGGTVTIGGGDYGWIIDKEAEAAQLDADIQSGEAVTREPIYQQTAKERGTDDIGDSYVEIDYTNQHLWYYEEGKLVVDTDIVSGNISTGHGSPDGVFKIVYKQSPAVLKGEDYESDVTYFMPFAYNVGIHDASWRNGKFGGDIYKTSGSHGCVNVPEEAAETIYNTIAKGTPVVAYYRDVVELTAENAKISNAYSYVEPETENEAVPVEETPVAAE